MEAENVSKKHYIMLFVQEALKVGAHWSKPHKNTFTSCSPHRILLGDQSRRMR